MINPDHSFHYRREQEFDARFGLDTVGRVERAEYSNFHGREIAERYAPIYIDLFPELIALIPGKPDDWVFVDIGAGKGRAVLLASEFPFKKIVGIEIAPELHTIMQNNIRIYASPTQQCTKLEASLSDARSCEFPDDDCVFYLFNPVTAAAALGHVIANIRAWNERTGRRIFLLFLYATEGNGAEEVLRKSGIFDVVSHDPAPFGWKLLKCYSSGAARK